MLLSLNSTEPWDLLWSLSERVQSLTRKLYVSRPSIVFNSWTLGEINWWSSYKQNIHLKHELDQYELTRTVIIVIYALNVHLYILRDTHVGLILNAVFYIK